MAAAHRAATMLAQDIGDLPKCKNPARRRACLASFSRFCRTYFPEIFYLPWSKDLRKVVAKIERVVRDHDKLAVAMPRGSGKTRLLQAAILWGILSGRHHFAMLIGAVAKQAWDAIEWFKKVLSENKLLCEDFPEVCYPIRLLENEPRRCLGQRYKGKKTFIRWGKDRIVLPTIKGSRASGAVIEATSLEGHIRGAWAAMPDGTVIRPTLAMCDDPQTPESARSQGPNGQTTYRLQVINQDVQGLAGPDRQTAILVACTVICPGDLADQLLDRKTHPDFRGERTKRIYSWPQNKALWEQYRQLREAAMLVDEPVDEADRFYRARMATCEGRLDEVRGCDSCPRAAECMDCGIVVDWAERLDDPRNRSAAQAAMHAFYKYGPSGFAAEFQNEPIIDDGGGQRWNQAIIASRYTGRPRGEVPIECTEITAAIDVQQWSLWYVIVAWTPNFTGHVIDYGIWPKQTRAAITKAEIENSRNNLQTRYAGRGIEGAIQAGLEDCVRWMLARDFPRGGGAGLMRISRLLVDAGKWDDKIAAVKMKVGGATMLLSKGIGIRAGTAPMAKRRYRPGEGKRDPFGHWYMPAVRGTKEFPHIALDTNFWKSFVEQGILTAPGDPGAITLFGDGPQQHSLFAAHLDAETWTETEGHGRKVHEWTIRPNRPDNEWLDCMSYAAVAASYQGCARAGGKAPMAGVIRRRRVSINELLARRQTTEALA